MRKGIIGIAGGMGPGAGIDLARNIVEQTVADRDQEHLPQVLFSLPEQIYDRTEYILGKVRTNPGYRIAQVIRRMEMVGVGLAGIACNSAHAPVIYDAVESELLRFGSKVQLLHMIREVAIFLAEHYPTRKSIGVLGTTGTYLTRQYDLLADYDMEVIYLPEKEQRKVHLSVYHPEYGVKSIPENSSPKAERILVEASDALIRMGADAIVLGCTEFPLIYRLPYYKGLPMVNSSLALARALIREHSPHKLKPWE